jgi:hypothetical protein
MKIILRHLVLPLTSSVFLTLIGIWTAQRYPAQFGVFIAFLIVLGIIRERIARRRAELRGWRFSPGRDEIFYHEKVNGEWKEIRIYVGVSEDLKYSIIDLSGIQFPAWALNHKDEIIARIKSEYSPPQYEYDEEAKTGM